MLPTTPARIEGIHRLAEFYAPHGWPDLPNPKGKIGLRPYQYHQLERWMARKMPVIAAAENKAAWLHNRYTQGETSRDAVNRMNPKKPKGRRSEHRMRMMDLVVDFIAENGTATSKQVSEHMQVKVQTVRDWIDDLRDHGRIEGQWVIENGRPVRHYSVTERQEAAE